MMGKSISSIKFISLFIVSTYLVSACSTQSTSEQTEHKIYYTCIDGTGFWITYPFLPDKILEETIISHFTRLYGQAPEDCNVRPFL